VRAILEPLRAVADEIIVAVDARSGEAEIPQYAAVADRVLAFEPGPPHGTLTWLHSQCRGEWIFSIAGDEVVSPALLEALPELIGRRDALQVAMPLRWVHPDGAHWLAGPPWEPDFHVRLMRNGGTLRFSGRKHELALPVRPARFVEEPIWHLNLLVLDEAARREKAATNETQRPGLTVAGRRSLNRAYYLPEDAPDAPLAPLPERDREAIAAALAPPERPGREGQAVPATSWTEIERTWAGRTVGAGAYHARVEPWLDCLRLAAGENSTLYVRVHNDGDEPWPWGWDQPPFIRLGGRWHGETGVPELRATFPHEVLPGESCIVPVQIVAPPAGRWQLEIGVLHEDVRWFGSACRMAVEIDP
jgi:hypothetical protein